MCGGHILALAGIGLQVIKFKWFPYLQPDRFPVAHAHCLFGAFLMEFPIEELVLVGLFLAEERWEHRNAINVGGRFDSGDLRGCWKKIPEGPDLIAHRLWFDLSWPSDNHWDADSTLVHIALDPTQWT